MPGYVQVSIGTLDQLDARSKSRMELNSITTERDHMEGRLFTTKKYHIQEAEDFTYLSKESQLNDLEKIFLTIKR